MISPELKKILNLVKKTGDRVIVYDAQETEETFVLMDFNSYEKMNSKELKLEEKPGDLSIQKQIEDPKIKNLTEEELTDKINREISLWKNQENPSFVAGDQKVEKPTKPWSIPPKVKENAKEVE
ncbi:hypothetical protein GW758_02780 [Candidatus Falkowbacteria bacterium]|nr:hypothetical protein [Candidatus Falkowbacteria bacterium]NCT54854.1 hypothetical protein [Candidatus Falkowbacteria bacterium]